MKPYILVAIIINCIYHGCALEERQDRMFSLFNVVKFRNTACQATSSAVLQGTCYTAQECSDKGGTSDGNCASSFGVCCVVKANTCAAAATENCTFIESPSFPATIPAASTPGCAYTVTPSNPTEICQIRLDFTAVTLLQPLAATGQCNVDTLTILGGAAPNTAIGLIPPVLCGTLTGQHLYVDSAKATVAATIAFNVPTATVATQMWRIKVSQIECESKYAAPNGCLQFFTGNSGTVTSFNFDGLACTTAGCFLQNQDYSVCFKQEPGMCSISFTPTQIAAGSAFALTTNAGVAIAVALSTRTAAIAALNNCAVAYVGIRADNLNCHLAMDVYCGGALSPVVAAATISGMGMVPATSNGVVTSSRTPFDLRVFAANAAQNAVAGFSLDYSLVACGN